MISRTGLAVLLLSLSACDPPNAPSIDAAKASAPAAAVNPDPGVRTYVCADGRRVQAGYPDRDTAVVEVDGHAYTLKAQVAADGVRYAGFGLQWWTKGMREARLSRLKDGETIASDPGVVCRTEETGGPVAPPPPGAAGGLPDDRRPLAEGPISPKSAQGAAQVVQTYYALLESGRTAEAWRLWSQGSPQRAVDEAAFARKFAGFADYHAQIGAPGAVEGAAGSLYVEVPVVVYGRLKSGEAVHQSGTATLRRVNDVPGSTAEQRSWRIQSIDLRGQGASGA